ncbi:hypothetical protein PVL29_009337 [Vitis rotundifolia]|uniref:Uncharacterized protein n=1 Tax=Vitis rotundifolia TaxID=103349 RepID=A0AA38ZY55_VITRO|nr:hypothetical protein PVL29_009337 [Vitis rotundifolia]
MAVFVRSKRVTDPLDDRVKARIVGRDSGRISSDSSSDAGEESPCLSDLVYGFLEDCAEAQTSEMELGSENDDDDSSPFDPTEVVASLLYPTANVDRYRTLLLSHVSKAVGSLSCPRSNKAAIRRNVAAVLRDLGHNAAVCRTKWDGSGGLTAGNYEFIDVLRSEKRYIVDLDFAGEFEIARPTDQYKLLIQTLPRVFIGKSEDLKKIVKLTCDAAKRSLKSRGLHLPPWRKNRYMQNKWFGPCRRTATPSPPLAPASTEFTVKCRSVGFDAVSDGRFFVRTR